MPKVTENVSFLNSAGILAALSILYTVPSDLDRVQITYCRIMNATGLLKTIQLIFVPAGGSAGSADSTVLAQRIGAFESLLITEAVGEWLDGGGTIRAEGSASGTNLTVNGTTWDIGS